MATNADIAKAAGVSPAIVSRIVNGDETLRVSAETRARVLRLIDEMDYAPNIAARSLKAAKTGVIALIVHDLTSSVYAEIIAGAHEGALDFGKAVLVGEASQSAGRSPPAVASRSAATHSFRVRAVGTNEVSANRSVSSGSAPSTDIPSQPRNAPKGTTIAQPCSVR